MANSQSQSDVKKFSMPVTFIGNTDTKSLVDIKGAETETYGFGESHLISKEKGGINDNGEQGEENVVSMYGRHSDMFGVGKASLIVGTIDTVKRFKVRDFDDDTVDHIIFFEHRREHPVAHFTQTRDVKTGIVTTSRREIEDGGAVIKEPTTTIEEVDSVVTTIILALNSKKMEIENPSELFKEISQNGLGREITSPSQKFQIIDIFSRHIVMNEHNMSVIKKALLDLPDDMQPVKPSAFSENLSEKYNYVELEGVIIWNEKSAYKLAEIVSPEALFSKKQQEEEANEVLSIREKISAIESRGDIPRDKKENMISELQERLFRYQVAEKLSKDTQRLLQTKGYISGNLSEDEKKALMTVEERLYCGVDSTGSIVLTEDTNVKRIRGGSIYSQHIQKNEDIRSAKKHISTLRKKVFPSGGGRQPSDSAIQTAVAELLGIAKRLAEELGEQVEQNYASDLDFMLSRMLPMAKSIINREKNQNTKKEAERAYYQAKDIERLITGFVISLDDIKRSPFENNLEVLDGGRIRQMSNSTHKPDHFLERIGIDKDTVNHILISANIPVLDVGAKPNVLNFFDKASPIASVFVDKKTKEVVAISPENSIEYWLSEQSRLGRVLNSILDIDPNDEKAELLLSNQVGYGAIDYSKIDNTNKRAPKPRTGDGLLAIKNNGSAVSRVVSDILQEMRDIVYPDGNLDLSMLDKLKTRILGLSRSDDRNERKLGLYTESVRRNRKENYALDMLYSASMSSSLNASIVNTLKMDKDEREALSFETPMHKKAVFNSVAIVEKYIGDLKSFFKRAISETNNSHIVSDIMSTAHLFGKNVFRAQKNTLLVSGSNPQYRSDGGDGNYVFVAKPDHRYPESINLVSGIRYDSERGYVCNTYSFDLIDNSVHLGSLKGLLFSLEKNEKECNMSYEKLKEVEGVSSSNTEIITNEVSAVRNTGVGLIPDDKIDNGRVIALDIDGIVGIEGEPLKSDEVSQSEHVSSPKENISQTNEEEMSKEEAEQAISNIERRVICNNGVPTIIASELPLDVNEHEAREERAEKVNIDTAGQKAKKSPTMKPSK